MPSAQELRIWGRTLLPVLVLMFVFESLPSCVSFLHLAAEEPNFPVDSLSSLRNGGTRVLGVSENSPVGSHRRLLTGNQNQNQNQNRNRSRGGSRLPVRT
jgi:hypothetical protein